MKRFCKLLAVFDDPTVDGGVVHPPRVLP
jgi:hypothetical protein